ncbi:MAG TPA: iron ABC transporter permease [Clostridiaceae bacterium]|nr:iron ABC transporter permease [Clostridiaceae bacterium]
MANIISKRDTFSAVQYIGMSMLVLAALILCLSLGSVSVPLRDVFTALQKGVQGGADLSTGENIVLHVRLPRVLAVTLVGAALSLCGVAMQGLLRNPLADGATLGVSAGASLGAVVTMAFGLSIPGVALFGRVGMAILFAFLSLILILALAYRLDSQLSTNSIILIGVVFSLFASALMSLILTFAAEKTRDIVFWTMGSLAGADLTQVLLLAAALLAAGGWLIRLRTELNAFAIGESNAHAVGVDVKRVKLLVLILVSILIGVTVAIGGTIGFVGLVVPHMGRLLVGPNHRKLMPATLFFGAVFLLIADLVARTIASPLQIPIGVITSLVGAVAFIFLFWRQARGA